MSLSKHLGFGMIFAAPLAGFALASLLTGSRRWLRLPAIGAVVASLAALAIYGADYSASFLSGWVQDQALRPVLAAAVELNPGRPILGEQPAAQRYEMRQLTNSHQWADTYSFTYSGLSGPAAYRQAIHDHYFGVIYLSYTTKNASVISTAMANQGANRYYHLVAKVPRVMHGKVVGPWLVYAPQETLIVHGVPASKQDVLASTVLPRRAQ
jgi:hypothetical protein